MPARVANRQASDNSPRLRTPVSTVNETSQLLPLLLERLAVRGHLSIFDAGPASRHTVNFFSKFKCRLHFADLYADPLVADQATLTSKELGERFTEILSFAVEPFDLCLLWDVPNYLNPRALIAFGDALHPLVHSQTVAHGYCTFQGTQLFSPMQYGIRDPDTLAVEPRSDEIGPVHPATQNTLVAALSFLSIVRGTLLTDGRVELFLEAA